MAIAHRIRPVLLASAALAALAACDGKPLDWDLRDKANESLGTTAAAQTIANRPQPDSRGVISYPNYQVVVAQRGDTVNAVATRLGINGQELASYNGLSVNTELRPDEVLALPTRIADAGSAATSAPLTAGAIQTSTIDVTSIASSALDRAGPQATVAAPAAAASTTPATVTAVAPGGVEPIRHQVQRGETAYTIARLYNLPVRTVAQWNGLGPDLSVREGQFLMIPQSGSTPAPAAPTTTEEPGAGSATPTPPSAATPLPAETPATAAEAAEAPAPVEAPAIAPAPAAAPSNPGAPLVRPVEGSIISAYAPGKNEGINIGAPAGATVKAAAAGTVAAITRDTNGIAVVVIRHSADLLTVYTNLDGLTVAKDQAVTQGQKIGVVKAGDPSFVHFEVRRGGMQSADPEDYLQ